MSMYVLLMLCVLMFPLGFWLTEGAMMLTVLDYVCWWVPAGQRVSIPDPDGVTKTGGDHEPDGEEQDAADDEGEKP